MQAAPYHHLTPAATSNNSLPPPPPDGPEALRSGQKRRCLQPLQLQNGCSLLGSANGASAIDWRAQGGHEAWQVLVRLPATNTLGVANSAWVHTKSAARQWGPLTQPTLAAPHCGPLPAFKLRRRATLEVPHKSMQPHCRQALPPQLHVHDIMQPGFVPCTRQHEHIKHAYEAERLPAHLPVCMAWCACAVPAPLAVMGR